MPSRLQVEFSSRAFAGLEHQRRQLAGRTGCGICGAESIEHAVRPLARVTARPSVPLAHVNAALQALDQAQQIRNDTGATHAAGWVDAEGRLLLCREDVGRHNALDKLIGAMQRQGIDAAGGFALISSRASYEMVQKAARAGIGAWSRCRHQPLWRCAWPKTPAWRWPAGRGATASPPTPTQRSLVPDGLPRRGQDPAANRHRCMIPHHTRKT
jgi:hypothetical protein